MDTDTTVLYSKARQVLVAVYSTSPCVAWFRHVIQLGSYKGDIITGVFPSFCFACEKTEETPRG